MHRSRIRQRLLSVLAAVAVAMPMVIAAPVIPEAMAAAPSGIGFTQEGCNNPGALTLPNGSGDFICPDANYTTGNLGKNWAELDLVPLRVTVSASNSAAASSTFCRSFRRPS